MAEEIDDTNPYRSPETDQPKEDNPDPGLREGNPPLTDFILLLMLIAVGIAGAIITFVCTYLLVAYSNARLTPGGSLQAGNERLGFLVGTIAGMFVLAAAGYALLKLLKSTHGDRS